MKKNNFSRHAVPGAIGPPILPPKSWRRILPFSTLRALFAKLLALKYSLRACSKTLPRYWLVPRRVTNFRLTPPAPESAPRPALSTVTSSTAPRRAGTVPKKLVPPLFHPFDELFTPSIVGLMVPPGMPL
jgi:hypothetical protein